MDEYIQLLRTTHHPSDSHRSIPIFKISQEGLIARWSDGSRSVSWPGMATLFGPGTTAALRLFLLDILVVLLGIQGLPNWVSTPSWLVTSLSALLTLGGLTLIFGRIFV